MAQRNLTGDDPLLSLPRPAQVEKITVEPGGIEAFTPQSLLKILPYLVATEGLYLARKFPQKGTIRLRNGTVLHWMAFDKNSLELHSGNKLRFFVLRAKYGLMRKPARSKG